MIANSIHKLNSLGHKSTDMKRKENMNHKHLISVNIINYEKKSSSPAWLRHVERPCSPKNKLNRMSETRTPTYKRKPPSSDRLSMFHT